MSQVFVAKADQTVSQCVPLNDAPSRPGSGKVLVERPSNAPDARVGIEVLELEIAR